MVTGVPGGRARSALAGGPAARFADVRWVATTGSTNADALQLARDGAPEGVVVVADHQTAGRGRRGRVWEAPPGASLLVSVVLRPPAPLVEAVTMAVGVAAAEAVEAVAGFAPRLKWPNDLVWEDRKLAGILAEADWPAAGPPAVVVGIGINVAWPAELPADLAEIAVAGNHVTGQEVDRETLLVALLERLEAWYGPMVASGDVAPLRAAWRARSATLGRRVRVDLGPAVVEGVAEDVTAEGHLVVRTDGGDRRAITTGDVVHLRDV
jgi:BirA family biotin operon repressor/biotin-[acetyl-CoA-carboxylase] ligase